MAKKAERKAVCSVSFPQGEMDRGRESGKEELKKICGPYSPETFKRMLNVAK